jgi:RNA polymerase sigma-70 factor (ECF subfamily)
MLLLQRGDATAFERLLERYQRRLFGFLLRRAPSQHAEDLFQETWLRVVRSRGSFDPARRFSTWLFQIANNLCRDGARRSAVEAKDRTRQQAELPSQGAAGMTALDAKLDAQKRLAQLPESLREVLVLRYFEDLGEREIAEIVGVPPGTVKSRLHAAVRALRGASEEHDVGC